MTGPNGIAPRWLEALCLGMGLPLLLVLVLTGGLPQRPVMDEVRDGVARAPALGGHAADRGGQSRAAVKLAGWRVFLHAAGFDAASLGPASATALLPAGPRNVPKGWSAVRADAAAAPHFYRSQAPPVSA